MPVNGSLRDRVPGEPTRSQIIEGLIEIRQSGGLQGVWIDADVIRVRYEAWGTPVRISWHEARVLIQQHRIGRAG
jgi:hypothetical protein